MGFVEDLFKGNLGTGLIVGLAGAILGPVVIPAVGKLGKPLAKTIIKGGIRAYDGGTKVVTSIGTGMSDLVAEARSDIEKDRRAARETKEHSWTAPSVGASESGPEPPV